MGVETLLSGRSAVELEAEAHVLKMQVALETCRERHDRAQRYHDDVAELHAKWPDASDLLRLFLNVEKSLETAVAQLQTREGQLTQAINKLQTLTDQRLARGGR